VDGYITKAMPSEGEARYLNRGNEEVVHVVTPGESLSVVAYKYDLNMATILWQNPTLGNGYLLKVGQEIKIPPADGYEVKVDSGKTLDSLIEKYDGDRDQTIAINDLDEEGTLVEGSDLFIVGGEKPYTYVATADTRTTTVRSDDYVRGTMAPAPEDTPAIVPTSGNWVLPCPGSRTQGYHWGHYAWDWADRSMPICVAADGGTVVKADAGGWGGGYGTHTIIDHGNGYKTLYAHFNELYVSVGDVVAQGQPIGQMGATGRVYGATGIHLHLELIYNGSKIDPAQVFGY